MSRKKIIIIAIIIVVLAAIIIAIASSKKKKAKEEQRERLRKIQADMDDPNKSTVTQMDGTIITKDQAQSKQTLNEQIRDSDQYKKFYGSADCKKRATTIIDAWGTFNDDEAGVYNSLRGLNKYTLLALRDYMCNKKEQCSIEMYLRNFFDTDEYNKAVEIMNQARKKG